jgi:hypothetical protein
MTGAEPGFPQWVLWLETFAKVKTRGRQGPQGADLERMRKARDHLLDAERALLASFLERLARGADSAARARVRASLDSTAADMGWAPEERARILGRTTSGGG